MDMCALAVEDVLPTDVKLPSTDGVSVRVTDGDGVKASAVLLAYLDSVLQKETKAEEESVARCGVAD